MSNKHRALLNRVRLHVVDTSAPPTTYKLILGHKPNDTMTIKMRSINSKVPTWNKRQYGP